MSADDNNAADALPCCASCGIAQVDDIKLKECDRCDLAHYCSDECKQEHREKHEEACKQRAAELRDELLFKQPESNHLGDCPICCLPLPLDIRKSTIYNCCSKYICIGCCYANKIREREMRVKKHSCPFCRKPLSRNDEDWKKRLEANDPVALCDEGGNQHEKGNYTGAIDYFTKAAKLGFVEAHFRLGGMHLFAEGVEMDEEKGKYHLEEAAIGGHPHARFNVGILEFNNANVGRAIKHLIISAGQGEAKSIKRLTKAFKQGLLEKEDLASALRANQAAVDATKSAQRNAAERIW